MEEDLSEIMLKEHKRIHSLLNDFNKCLINGIDKKCEDAFSIFKWNLEKHFFIEEKAVFSSFVKDDDVDEIFEMLNEHREIMNELSEIDDYFYDGIKFDVTKLRDLLEKHSDFENETFYPKLDRLLSAGQKQEIIERAKEIIRG